MRNRPASALALLVCLASLPLSMASAAPPEEGDCPTVSGASSGTPGEEPRDAAPLTLREGMVLTLADLLILRELVPKEIWRHREVFFHEGMQMEIGPCHRRYPAPGFFHRATEALAKEVRIDAEGNLSGYQAGLPFPPAEIDLEAKDAGLRWAWNLQQRFRGGGHRGHFRIVDFPSRYGSEQTYEGDFFLLPLRGRADLADSDYRIEGSRKNDWVAGGHFTKPFNARHIAWRQFRPLEARKDANEPDDTFVYVPTMRKSRRASTSWVDGFYLPTYTVAGDSGSGGPMPLGESGGSINPSAGRDAAVTENAYKGFEGLVLRPNAYLWRVNGTRDVLAPINGTRVGFPNEERRNFGTSGLSVASDRWEVRHAVVIEGALRRQDEGIRTVTYLVDYQTQLPLYRFTRAGKRHLLDIQIFVHRFSGDQHGYPEWPGGVPTFVFDPVAQVSYNALQGGGGWRRESYDILSVPFSEEDLTGLISAAALDHGH